MKSEYKIFLLATFVIFALSACRASPIINIDNAGFEINEKHSSADIKKAIFRAGTSLGWVLKYKKEGQILATLVLRKHVAIVNITYNKKSYSITYKDSQNLDYDGKTIHQNYNGWVTNLNKGIQIQLNNL